MLCRYLAGEQDTLRQKLNVHGGLLFRGFGIDSVDVMSRAVRAFGGLPYKYEGGNSPRKHLASEVYTSTDYPASETISLHHEMSYQPSWPATLFFHCILPARTGGQTTLASTLDVSSAMPEEITAAFRRKRLNYIRTFHPKAAFGKTWQATYLSDDRDEVEALIARQGASCRWGEDGSLRVSAVCDAFVTDPRSQRELWFNQAEQWHPSALHPEIRAMFERSYGVGRLAHHCEHADGDPIDEDMLASIRQVLHDNSLLFDWERGDFLIVDNLLMMHGRQPFAGPRQTGVFLSAV